jgi:hypothetical protein
MNLRRNAIRAGIVCGLLGLSACHIALISDYDDAFDQQLISSQKDIAGFFQKMADNVSTTNNRKTAETYAQDTDAITKIHTDLSAMRVRAAAHPKNEATTSNVDHLAHTFAEFEAEYKASATTGPLDVAHINTELTIINADFTVMMAEELLKKQGSTTTGASK